MANEVSIGTEILNLNQVYDVVSKLNNIEKDKAIKYALRRAGGKLVAGGRRRLRGRMKDSAGVSGNLLKSFKVRVKRRKLGALAGFSQDYDAYKVGKDGYGSHASLVDRGSKKERFWKKATKKGIPKSTGWMPALSFWTDTFEQDGKRAVTSLMANLERAVERIIQRR
ncbi:hypothetical protein [Bacteroides sedimenti]|uniref:HK97 gp10 family phage protein n=1 Tax=Bacteroides sedimenti TaxID=2136147 RepID=A0ABM8IF60_9BACE